MPRTVQPKDEPSRQEGHAACIKKHHALGSDLDSAISSHSLPCWPPMAPRRPGMRQWTEQCLAWGQRQEGGGFLEQEEEEASCCHPVPVTDTLGPGNGPAWSSLQLYCFLTLAIPGVGEMWAGHGCSPLTLHPRQGKPLSQLDFSALPWATRQACVWAQTRLKTGLKQDSQTVPCHSPSTHKHQTRYIKAGTAGRSHLWVSPPKRSGSTEKASSLGPTLSTHRQWVLILRKRVQAASNLSRLIWQEFFFKIHT